MEEVLNNNKIDEIMNSAMKNIKSIIDVNTVIGTPLENTDGVTIIPISKVTMGFLAGGGEYGESLKKFNEFPFAGGSGAAVTLNPVGFLVGTGPNLKIISLENSGSIEKLVEGAAELIAKFTDKKVFK